VVTSRHLYSEYFEYRPEFKLFLVANNKPKLSHDDTGIWRRIRVVPFDHAIPDEKQNPKIKAELLNVAISGAAILRWALDGCLMWQREGLKKLPRAVKKATQAYRDDMDPLGEWLEDYCERDEKVQTAVSDLYVSFTSWAKTQDGWTKAPSSKWFALRLDGHGFHKVEGRDRPRRGLKLTEAEARRVAAIDPAREKDF
jgi:putative DNA primase/helicase